MATEIPAQPIPNTFWGMTKSFGWLWWSFHATLLLLGFLSIICPIQYPDWMTRAMPAIDASKFHLLTATLCVTIPVSHLIGHTVAYRLSVLFRLTPWASRENLYPPALIGVFEALMIPLFFLIGRPEFTGAWLLLKVAGGWKGWQDNPESRRRFYKFLIGNVVTIFIGATTFLFLRSFVLK